MIPIIYRQIIPMKRGLLLVNLGTPNNTNYSSVRSYLREFLTDSRVVDLPILLRYLFIYIFILPFRTKYSARAYQSIWTKHGSPLLYHSHHLATQIQKEVGVNYQVALGMRYGKPSIRTALNQLSQCESITILPLYPQYASATSGSSIAEVLRIISSWNLIPSLEIIRDFFQHPAYIKAQAQIIKPYLYENAFILFSYHGLPERHLIKSNCNSICFKACPSLNDKIQGCYRAQCYQSTRLLAKELQLSIDNFDTTFQSRFGKTSWIKPYTDEVLAQLISKGIKKLIIVCPSFVADCLETLEEIGIRAKKQWEALGGEELLVIPSMNADPSWIKALIQILSLQAHKG